MGFSRVILLYTGKIKNLNRQDPYEIPKTEWKDDVKYWPDVTYIHVAMS